MKKRMSIVLAFAMIFTCIFSFPTFATEATASDNVAEVQAASDIEISPRAGFNGYGNHWYNSGEPTHGSFTVNATGSSNPGYMTLNIDSFSSDVGVWIKVYRPGGKVEVYDTMAWRGEQITMENRDSWYGIRIPNATAGDYVIEYTIYGYNSSGRPSSGRINVWFYN